MGATFCLRESWRRSFYIRTWANNVINSEPSGVSRGINKGVVGVNGVAVRPEERGAWDFAGVGGVAGFSSFFDICLS